MVEANVQSIQRQRAIPTVGDDGDVVLTFGEWCRLAGLGESTGRKLKAAGKGPRFVRLTDKKLGVTLREHRRWVKARTE
jgi:hypothetical protein